MRNFIRSYHNGDKELWRKRWAKNRSALEFFDYADLELIVIAQCWEDDMVEEVLKEFPRIKFDRQGKLGCGGALNYALQNYLYNTSDDCIFLMDDDVEFLNSKEYNKKIWDFMDKNMCHLKATIGPTAQFYSKKTAIPTVDESNTLEFNVPVHPGNISTFFTNTKKFYNKEILTKDFHVETGNYCHEDRWLGCQYMIEKVPFYRLANFQVNTFIWGKNSVIAERDIKRFFGTEIQVKDFETITGVNYKNLIKENYKNHKKFKMQLDNITF